MLVPYEIELEPEVRAWLDSLPLEHYAKAEAMADLLAERAEELGEPYARHLGARPGNFGSIWAVTLCGSATGSLLVGESCC